MLVVGPASFGGFLAQDTGVLLDALAIVFVVVHQVVHLPLVLVEPNGGVVGLADVPKVLTGRLGSRDPLILLVRTEGLEPSRGYPLRILSPVCLPVPPRPLL